MSKILSLSGEWLVSGSSEQGTAIDVPVTIPGYVHQALEKAGIIPPIYWRDNSKLCQWVEKKEWTFYRDFTIGPEMDLSRAEIRFGGIDTYADVSLNGQKIGSSNNMFVPFTADVSKIAVVGKNRLEVVIHPYAEQVAGKNFKRGAAFTADRLFVRRVQCTFGWDWAERYVSAGLWKAVELVCPGEASISDLYVYTKSIDPTSASLGLNFQLNHALESGCRWSLTIQDKCGKCVWDSQGRAFLNEFSLQADLANPELWWPNGYGEHPLYTVTFRLFDKNGTELDSRTLKTGIRTVRLEMLRDQPGSEEEKKTKSLREQQKCTDKDYPGESFTLVVNGVRIFCKGGNYVPLSSFPGTPGDDEYENIVRLAAESNMNFLRIWGGGEYEPDIFYSKCDEYGIMLSHDFMLACGDYPEEEPGFVENLRREIHANLLALRNHCCIAYWSANNEDIGGNDWDDPNGWDLALLPEAYFPELKVLDPVRPFRYCCPWGGRSNGDFSVGDCHDGQWWAGAEKINAESFQIICRFGSENPCEGYPMPSVLKKFLSAEDLANPDSDMIDFHIKDNPHFKFVGMASVHERLKINADVMLGKTEDARQCLYHRAYLQYEWARRVIEGFRTAKWYASGIQFWMYNDSWPALGYSDVDFYGRPKSGWFSCRRAYAPLSSAVLRKGDSLACYVLNDSLTEYNVNVRILSADTKSGKVTPLEEFKVHVPENQNVVCRELPLPADDGHTMIFMEVLLDGKLMDRSRWCPGWLSRLDFAPAHLRYSRQGDTVCVECVSGIAIGVAFDGEFVLEDNFFDMLPGEKRTLKMSAPFHSETGNDVECYVYKGDFSAE